MAIFGINQGVQPVSVGNPNGTARGVFASWFNGRNIAKEDWLRNEQSAELAFARESEFNAEQAEITRAFNAQEAQKERDWQEEMSNTSYQRMVADLKKAGLSPVLAYSQGGASTPSGASASAPSASAGSRQGNFGRGYVDQSAAAVAGLAAQLIAGKMSNLTNLKIARENNKTRVDLAFFKSKGY